MIIDNRNSYSATEKLKLILAMHLLFLQQNGYCLAD